MKDTTILIRVIICLVSFIIPCEAFGSVSISKTISKRSVNIRVFSSKESQPKSEQGKSSGGIIPPDVIEEIKTYADIVSVIESYDLPLFSRASDGYRAKCICPFHNDRNPSLNIDNSRGIYKCFSCGAGGDVFNFVREYDFISSNGKGEKMSYPASIKKVASEFCGGAIAQQVDAMFSNSAAVRKLTPEKKEKMEELRKKKERILLANSAAADFYAKALIVNPTAGAARAHLHQRGITPAVVRTFALGFAPDVYFSNDNKNEWGKGSLVERLQEMKFTPEEILDAGLATVTSKARSRLQMSAVGTSLNEKDISTITMNESRRNETEVVITKNKGTKMDYLQYADLMDRFRSRLMVPIFDPSGRFVVGFGGRHLETTTIHKEKSNGKDSFVAAKYMNTPETPVFAKKNILFGAHAASVAIEERARMKISADRESQVSESNDVPTVVIVEGYMDAITLYGAGIKEVVASMGTALTPTQMKASSSVLAGRGKIILCLDNDEAGINAVERICTGSHIWDFLEQTAVEVEVASLPTDIKDPADYIEANGGIGKASSGEKFREEILGASMPWNDWFITRLISKYDPNDTTSFSNVCDDIATFLSNHPNAADRTKRAFEAAGKLAALIGKDSSSSHGPLRIQLESDLLSMASRKASAREALSRRVEDADGEKFDKNKLARLNSGEATRYDDLPSEVKNVGSGDPSNLSRVIPTKTKDSSHKQSPYNSRNTSINYRSQKRRIQKDDISKHFDGFQFSETDAEWLGVDSDWGRKNFIVGQVEGKGRNKKLVYFNSNDYLGDEKSILSTIANKSNPSDRAIENISNPLVKRNENRLLIDAEDRLLYAMVNFPSARLAMKSALSTRVQNGSPFLEWSSPEREWLFQCLTDSPGHEKIPDELQVSGNAEGLKKHLSSRQDAPDGAFRRADTETDSHTSLDDDDMKDHQAVEEDIMRFDTSDVTDTESKTKQVRLKEASGKLESYFGERDEISHLEIQEADDERAELTVQESVAMMLQAAALRRLSCLKADWEMANSILQTRALKEEESIGNRDTSPPGHVQTMYDSLSDIELRQRCNEIGQDVKEAIQTVHELTESAKQLNKRLLDYCSSEGQSSRSKKKVEEELFTALDEHINSLPDDPRPSTSGAETDYVFGMDRYDEKIDSRFGGNRPRFDEDPESGDASLYDSIFE